VDLVRIERQYWRIIKLSTPFAEVATHRVLSIDFITPFGHHNNTIVMGVGGYRFRDFPIAGFPVLVAVIAAVLFSLTMIAT
jgi:di/tricarboxylate transporter